MSENGYKKTSLKKNFIMNVLLQMSSFIFPLITFPYVSRILLPVGTGKVSFATSLISYFNMFAQLGIPTYGIRACAQVRDDRYKLTKTAHELLFINLIMSLAAYAGLAVALMFVHRLREDKLLYIIVSITILFNTIGMEWLYKALEQYTYITVRSVIFKFIALAAMFFLIHEQSDYVVYGAISIFAASASNIFNFFHAHKYIDMHSVGGYNFRHHLKAVFIFFAMACATTVYTNLDTVMLGFMTTDTDVGYYNAAIKIKNVLTSLVASLGTVLLPRNSYYIEHKMFTEFKRISGVALEFVFLVATPLMVYFIVFARPTILLLSGSAYEPATTPMQIIMPTLLFIGITNILGLQVLVPLGKEKIVLYSEIAGAITDLILNAIFIPFFKSSGAAFGTLMAEFVVLIVQYSSLKTGVNQALKGIRYLVIIAGVLTGTLGSIWVLKLSFNFLLVLVLSAFLFFGLYYFTLIIFKESLMVSISKQMLLKIKKTRLKLLKNV